MYKIRINTKSFLHKPWIENQSLQRMNIKIMNEDKIKIVQNVYKSFLKSAYFWNNIIGFKS